MNNGYYYSFMVWFRYLGIAIVWLTLLFGGVATGIIFQKSAGGVALALGMLGFAVIIMFRWLAKL